MDTNRLCLYCKTEKKYSRWPICSKAECREKRERDLNDNRKTHLICFKSKPPGFWSHIHLCQSQNT